MISRSINVLGIFLILLQYSCHAPKEEDHRTVFRYNESAGISSLDPAFARNVENIWAVNQLFNGLVQMNDSLEVIPCIARSWKISDDGITYTFYLRGDVRFHDHKLFPGGKGRKVVAEDFVHSFFRLVNPEMASPGAWLFNLIDRTKDLGFTAINDTILQMHLTRPFQPFLSILTMQYCSVVPYEIVEHYGSDFRTHPVGTGPFRFKLWKEGVKLILEKNPDYFETDRQGIRLPYLDAVAISFLSEKNTSFLEFLQGNLDFLSGLDEIPQDEVLTQNGHLKPKYQNRFQSIIMPSLRTDYLGILVDENLPLVKNSPLRLRQVRQAINYAIDRQTMVMYMLNSVGRPAHSGIIPYGMPSFAPDQVKGYIFNPDSARRLLADAGFPNGKGIPEILLHTSSDYEDMCQFIQNQLAEVGIPVKIEVTSSVTLRELVAKSAVNIFRKNWVADYPDAENFLAIFYSKNFSPIGPNYTHFQNEEYDHLYEKAQAVKGKELRYLMYRKMDSIVVSEAPVVFLYYGEMVQFFQNNITGLTPNPMNLLTLKRVKKK